MDCGLIETKPTEALVSVPWELSTKSDFVDMKSTKISGQFQLNLGLSRKDKLGIDILLKHLLDFKVCVVDRVVQTRLEPDNPAKLPDTDPIPAQTKGPVDQWWVSVLKNRRQQVEWRVCISKTRATRT